MRLKLEGKGFSDGLAMADILFYSQKLPEIPRESVEDPQAEVDRFRVILDKGKTELQKLYDDALARIGEADAEIFLAHQTILEDEFSVQEPIEQFIQEEKMNAAAAIERQFDELAQMFLAMDDELMSARAADFTDIKMLLIRIALGCEKQDISRLDKDVILLAEELTPSDTVRMDIDHIKGIATCLGGPTAHSAIIARQLGIPAVSGITDWQNPVWRGVKAIIDGYNGWLLMNPEEGDVGDFKVRDDEYQRQAELLKVYKDKASVTADGQAIEICANIGTPNEAKVAMDAGADGVGLFRSEFLFMDREDLPSEEEQYKAYREALIQMNGRPLIVRTLDIGGDKKLPALPLAPEDNPFLGLRAVRLTLKRPDIFRPQLRALLRASAEGDLRIMFPMISNMGELRAAKAILKEEQDKLKAEGLDTSSVKVGMMVEIPAAALMADAFAKEVDFFSIGTNDLTQYTLAVERNNGEVTELYIPNHPAVLKLIAMTGRAAVANGIPCGMCGEAAADPKLAPAFVGMGVTELSMTSKRITATRKLISELTMDECREKARQLLGE